MLGALEQRLQGGIRGLRGHDPPGAVDNDWVVPPQNPVDRTIVDVSALRVKLDIEDISIPACRAQRLRLIRAGYPQSPGAQNSQPRLNWVTWVLVR
jgi:hypothetical protein